MHGADVVAGARQPSVEDLAERYGTPAYLYELDEVDEAVRRLRWALPGTAILFYSLKANPHPRIAQALRESGCRAEISSAGELAAALAAGFSGAECLYTGPAKTAAEIGAAVAAGVRLFSAESAADYETIAATAGRGGVTVDCLVRVNAGGARGASGLRMSGVASQFGVDAATLLAHPGVFAPRPGARVVGLHFFPLSNAASAAAIVDEALANIDLAVRLRDEAGVALRLLDLGGGFAAPYARPGDGLDYGATRPVVEQALDDRLPGWRHGEPAVAFESGRYLAGRCGRLVARVADVKRSHDRTFVVLDGGINHLGGLSGLGRMLPVAAAVLPARATTDDGVTDGSATVVGPLCTPADVLARQTTGAGFRRHDLVVIPNVGAYGLTASLIGFLGRPAPVEVVLRGGSPVEASRLELRRTPVEQERATT